jgi:hypothetical protein
MSKIITTELNGKMVKIEVLEKDGVVYASVKKDEPVLQFIWDIDGRCGLYCTYSELKEKYEIVEVDLGKGYLIKKNMTDKKILSNFSRPIKFERKELTYYRIWNHDLISYADNSKETQDWMDKHIRVFNDDAYRQSYKEANLTYA